MDVNVPMHFESLKCLPSLTYPSVTQDVWLSCDTSQMSHCTSSEEFSVAQGPKVQVQLNLSFLSYEYKCR